jgi:hypothetical protein
MSHTGLTSTVNALATVPGNGQLVYAGTNNGLFRSTDAGATWAVTSITQQVRALVVDPVHTANVYAGTYGAGVYASTDGGTTWSPMNTGLTCNKVLSLALRPGAENTLYAGTEGGSVFRTTVTTGMAGGSPLAPRRSPFTVSPNPCRAATTISFASPLTAPASFGIYDASGSLVRSFTVRTSSFVLRTSGLAEGTYFVRFTSGRETRSARLTILQ